MEVHGQFLHKFLVLFLDTCGHGTACPLDSTAWLRFTICLHTSDSVPERCLDLCRYCAGTVLHTQDVHNGHVLVLEILVLLEEHVRTRHNGVVGGRWIMDYLHF